MNIYGCEKASPKMDAALANIDREDFSTKCLSLYERKPSKFLHRFITVDETCVHQYRPESKEQSKQWTPRGEPASKKAKAVASAGKLMVTVFLECAWHRLD